MRFLISFVNSRIQIWDAQFIILPDNQVYLIDVDAERLVFEGDEVDMTTIEWTVEGIQEQIRQIKH